jgi:hypothetical protein
VQTGGLAGPAPRLVDGATHSALRGSVVCEALGAVQTKGKTVATEVFAGLSAGTGRRVSARRCP